MSQLLPIKRTKHQARRYYNRISGVYDWLTASENKIIQDGFQLLSPQPSESILEIGTGTGAALKQITQAVSAPGTVAGVDLSQKMLKKCQKKTHSSHLSPSLIQADGARLPLSANIFDGLLCCFTLELFSETEIPIVLNEIKRVLKPSGRLVVVALAQNPRNLAVRLYELAHRLFPVAVDCRPLPLINILVENGFDVIEKKKQSNWGLPIHVTMNKILTTQS